MKKSCSRIDSNKVFNRPLRPDCARNTHQACWLASLTSAIHILRPGHLQIGSNPERIL